MLPTICRRPLGGTGGAHCRARCAHGLRDPRCAGHAEVAARARLAGRDPSCIPKVKREMPRPSHSTQRPAPRKNASHQQRTRCRSGSCCTTASASRSPPLQRPRSETPSPSRWCYTSLCAPQHAPRQPLLPDTHAPPVPPVLGLARWSPR